MTFNKYNYVFLDESGKPEIYSARGTNLVENGQATKFLVLSAIRTDDQLLIQQQVTDYKVKLLKNCNLKRIFSSAYTLDSFHAQSDYPIIKENFYKFINTLNAKIDVMVVEKLKCFEALKRCPGK
jgi:predicted DNA-binding helix-hairpin-helix protein